MEQIQAIVTAMFFISIIKLLAYINLVVCALGIAEQALLKRLWTVSSALIFVMSVALFIAAYRL